MNKEHDSRSKKNRIPKDWIIIHPPFIPGEQGKKKPPFMPEFPPLYPEYDDEKETFKIKIKSVFEDEFVVVGTLITCMQQEKKLIKMEYLS